MLYGGLEKADVFLPDPVLKEFIRDAQTDLIIVDRYQLERQEPRGEDLLVHFGF